VKKGGDLTTSVNSINQSTKSNSEGKEGVDRGRWGGGDGGDWRRKCMFTTTYAAAGVKK